MGYMKDIAILDRERLEKEEREELLQREFLYLESTRGTVKPKGETARKTKEDEDKHSR